MSGTVASRGDRVMNKTDKNCRIYVIHSNGLIYKCTPIFIFSIISLKCTVYQKGGHPHYEAQPWIIASQFSFLSPSLELVFFPLCGLSEVDQLFGEKTNFHHTLQVLCLYLLSFQETNLYSKNLRP